MPNLVTGTELPMLACRLDLPDLRQQRDRYGALGTQVEEVVRGPGSLTVRFGPGLDEGLLHETLAIERGCCPFFELSYEPGGRLLRIGVAAPEQSAALDALAFALGAPASP
ncbi:MAG TPA: hypothetical protein VHZ54_14210 [Solirubrobacterales bacterium]|nr:hypothetical protein [Solirubrobacterales bacterium]